MELLDRFLAENCDAPIVTICTLITLLSTIVALGVFVMRSIACHKSKKLLHHIAKEAKRGREISAKMEQIDRELQRQRDSIVATVKEVENISKIIPELNDEKMKLTQLNNDLKIALAEMRDEDAKTMHLLQQRGGELFEECQELLDSLEEMSEELKMAQSRLFVTKAQHVQTSEGLKEIAANVGAKAEQRLNDESDALTELAAAVELAFERRSHLLNQVEETQKAEMDPLIEQVKNNSQWIADAEDILAAVDNLDQLADYAAELRQDLCYVLEDSNLLEEVEEETDEIELESESHFEEIPTPQEKVHSAASVTTDDSAAAPPPSASKAEKKKIAVETKKENQTSAKKVKKDKPKLHSVVVAHDENRPPSSSAATTPRTPLSPVLAN